MQTKDTSEMIASDRAGTHAVDEIRKTLRRLTDSSPENTAETLAGALAEVVNRHICAYGPDRAAQLCEKAAHLARTAPRGGY